MEGIFEETQNTEQRTNKTKILQVSQKMQTKRDV